jgi:hypothetical protein
LYHGIIKGLENISNVQQIRATTKLGRHWKIIQTALDDIDQMHE